MGLKKETLVELDRDHSDICKFAAKDDEAYAEVSTLLPYEADRALAHQIKCACGYQSPQNCRSSLADHQ